MSRQPLSLHATARLETWWKPKASNLLAVLYGVMLITGFPFTRALLLLGPSIATILGIGSFGHLINDLFDIAADRLAGKNNRMAMLATWQRIALLLLSLSVALLPWLLLPWDLFTVVLMTAEFLFLLAYAVPPVRLKERAFWAIVADAAYAYAIPAVMAAHTFFLAAEQGPHPGLLIALFCWQFLLGMRHYLNHLAIDRSNDLATRTPTLATRKNNAFIHSLIKNWLLPAEVAGFVALLIITGIDQPLLPVLALCFLLAYTFLPLILALGRNYSFFSYRFSKILLDAFYQGAWPLAPLLLLIFHNWQYSLLLAVHLLLFSPPVMSGVQRVTAWVMRCLIFVPAILVYPILRMKKKRPREKEDNDRTEKKIAAKKFSGPLVPAIAVVNINKQKYTETFINELIPRLKYRVFYLYGAELPRYDDEDRPFLSFRQELQTLAPFLEKLLRLDTHYFLKQSISNYLQAKKVRLVLAEFGPVGVQLSPIAADLGIPLVVYFHGYDVYHAETLRIYAGRYAALFRNADKILGVSESMLQALRQLGAPPEKLIHLPAYVNLELFPYHDHSSLPPRFLAVGRFAETKSPHLTILAFHRVVQLLPEATLTMAGKGGGGDLFEACLILVRSLGIEKNVQFRGVLSHEEVARDMQQARVFVQHSVITPGQHDREGKPVAIMEAMCCGLPVVATRHPGITELIEDKVTGLLVDEYNIEAMARAMLLLAKNDALVKELGLRASQAIRHHPLISRHVEVLESIIDGCMVQD